MNGLYLKKEGPGFEFLESTDIRRGVVYAVNHFQERGATQRNVESSEYQ